MNPAAFYRDLENRLRVAAPTAGLEAAYLEAFLRRKGRQLRAILLKVWPVWPVPKRENFQICDHCGGSLIRHDQDPVPHVAVMSLPCTRVRYRPLLPPGRSMADDSTWNRYAQQFTSRWGLCGECGAIIRLYSMGTRMGRMHLHTRPIDRSRDGRKRKEPDCEGTHQWPVVATRGPQ